MSFDLKITLVQKTSNNTTRMVFDSALLLHFLLCTLCRSFSTSIVIRCVDHYSAFYKFVINAITYFYGEVNRNLVEHKQATS